MKMLKTIIKFIIACSAIIGMITSMFLIYDYQTRKRGTIMKDDPDDPASPSQ